MIASRTAGTALAALFFASLGLTARAAPPPPGPAPGVETEIYAACVQEGGAKGECLCGLAIAREALTPRQMALFPVVWPIVKGPGDAFTKLGLGLQAAQARGYTAADAMTLVLAVQAHAGRTEKECAAK